MVQTPEIVREPENKFDYLPDEMKQLKRWLLWDREAKYDEKGNVQRDSQGNIKYTKVPKQRNGYKASKTNPDHYLTFDDAMRAYDTGKFSGIGFVLVESDPYVIIDLDDCFNEDGSLSEIAERIVESAASYTEISQSGNGLHIIVKGDNIKGFNNQKEGVEAYSQKWYFAVTGNVFRDDLATIEENNMLVDYVCDMYRPENQLDESEPVEDQPQVHSDDELVEKIRNSKQSEKFIALYDKGDTSNYGSLSEADQALANILAWWTKNGEQIERLMRDSALYREKWDKHPDYLRGRTIKNALQTVKGGYGVKPNPADDFQVHVKDKTELLPKPFLLKYGNLYKTVTKGSGKNKEEIDILISRKIPFLTKEFHNIENGNLFYEIEFDKHAEVVSASTISVGKELLELSNVGLSVNDANARDLIIFFDKYLQINELEQHYAVERLGKVKDKFIHPVLTKDIEIMAADHGEKQLREAFEVKGTAESWNREIFERIKDQPKAVFMVLSSFASVIINDLGVKPFVVESSGGTSQGKTTGLEIASTVYGNKNLVNEWNATPVAIERKAAYLNSFPLLMDDTRKAEKKTLSSIVYQFSGGRSKGRGSVKGSQREYTWQNILLSTGEVSLNVYAENHGGAAARVIPLGDEPLKRDYEMVVDLQAAMLDNYGAIGIEFLKIWESHKDDLIPEFNRVKKLYVKKSGDNNVLNRLAEFYAAVHFTGEVVKDYLGLDVRLNDIVKLFDEIKEENKDVDKPMKFLEDILSDLDSKRDNISGSFQAQDPLKAIYKDDQLYLLPAYTKEFLGVEESQTRKEWLKRGITIATEEKGVIVDYTTVRHDGKRNRAIPLNMDYVTKLGFDFKETS